MKIRLFLIVLLIAIYSTQAQQIVWNYIGTSEGLSSEYILDIFIENDTNIWLGTANGLNHFNGKRVTNSYTTTNSNLSNGFVKEVIKAQGKIWLRTDSGMSSFDGRRFTNYSRKNGLLSDTILDFCSASNGNIWLGSMDGVSKFDGIQFTHYPNEKCAFIESDSSDNIYLFLSRLALNSPSFSDARVYDGNGWNSYNTSDPKYSENILEVTKDNKNNLILKLSDGSFIEVSFPFNLNLVELPNEIKNQSIIDIDGDKRWYLQRGLFSLYRYKDSVSSAIAIPKKFNPPIYNTLESSSKHIYIGVEKGLLYVDKKVKDWGEFTLENSELRAKISGSSISFYDFLEYPKGSGVNSIYNLAFMTVAKDPATNKLSVDPRSPNFDLYELGPKNNSYGLTEGYITKVTKQEIETHKLNYNLAGNTISNGILEWPANGDSTLDIATNLAPFFDANNNGCYDPQYGDYPIIKGDEAIYFITHSLNPETPFEYHYMLYAYDSSQNASLNKSLFLQFRIVNRGNSRLDSLKTGLLVDTDLGFPGDDYVGCDSTNNIFYTYNADLYDDSIQNRPGYGSNPPALGFKVLNDTITNYLYYNIGGGPNGDPNTAIHWNNYLNSIWQNSQALRYGGDGFNSIGTSSRTTTHMYTGDPFLQTGWTERNPGGGQTPNVPGDRRGLASFPYYSLKPGEGKIIEIVIGYGRKDTTIAIAENVPELIQTLNKSKLYWDTVSIPQITYGSNYNCPNSTSIKEYELRIKSEVKLYPNPTSGIISLDSDEKMQRIEIMNSQAQIIRSISQNSKQIILDLKSSPSGIYFIRVLKESGKWETVKLLKQ